MPNVFVQEIQNRIITVLLSIIATILMAMLGLWIWAAQEALTFADKWSERTDINSSNYAIHEVLTDGKFRQINLKLTIHGKDINLIKEELKIKGIDDVE